MGKGKGNGAWNLAVQLWVPAVILIVVIFFFTALSNIGDGHDEAAMAQLEEVLRKTAVACYAAEGVYPPTVEYMEEYYGIQINRKRYEVHYQVFAVNIMPDITVLEKNG